MAVSGLLWKLNEGLSKFACSKKYVNHTRQKTAWQKVYHYKM